MLSGKFYDWEIFFFGGGGGVNFWSRVCVGCFCWGGGGGGLNFGPRICLGFVWNRWALIFAPIRSSLSIIPVTWIGGWVNLSGGGWGGVSVEIPVGWWKRDSPGFRSPEVGISDSALANHPTQFLPLLESIGFPPFKASRLGFTLLQLQRDITLTISQLPQFTLFLSRPSCSRHLLASPPSRASRGSAVHVFLVTPVKYLVALKKPVLTWLIIKVHNLTLAY